MVSLVGWPDSPFGWDMTRSYNLTPKVKSWPLNRCWWCLRNVIRHKCWVLNVCPSLFLDQPLFSINNVPQTHFRDQLDYIYMPDSQITPENVACHLPPYLLQPITAAFHVQQGMFFLLQAHDLCNTSNRTHLHLGQQCQLDKLELIVASGCFSSTPNDHCIW